MIKETAKTQSDSATQLAFTKTDSDVKAIGTKAYNNTIKVSVGTNIFTYIAKGKVNTGQMITIDEIDTLTTAAVEYIEQLVYSFINLCASGKEVYDRLVAGETDIKKIIFKNENQFTILQRPGGNIVKLLELEQPSTEFFANRMTRDKKLNDNDGYDYLLITYDGYKKLKPVNRVGKLKNLERTLEDHLENMYDSMDKYAKSLNDPKIEASYHVDTLKRMSKDFFNIEKVIGNELSHVFYILDSYTSVYRRINTAVGEHATK